MRRTLAALATAVPAAAAALTITGVHYPPPAGRPDLRFVEVHNDAATVLHLFGGLGPLPAPFPAAGADPTPDSLGC